jgi:hypothetical protein
MSLSNLLQNEDRDAVNRWLHAQWTESPPETPAAASSTASTIHADREQRRQLRRNRDALFEQVAIECFAVTETVVPTPKFLENVRACFTFLQQHARSSVSASELLD